MIVPGNRVGPGGYSLLRTLAEREGSKVYLASDSGGTLCALKVQAPRDPAKLSAIAARYARIRALTSSPGFVPLLAHGVTEQGWVWESMPLADNLPGLPSLGGDAGRQQYTPLTLRSWVTEKGPASAEQVGRWGMLLAEALGALHAEGLVHRDVKPANILFLGGVPHLGDYGLVGEPGAAVDFSGTEGFQPLEGTNDSAADLFALGKTLYEIWTGRDRLEFPSLPRSVLDAPEWGKCGNGLNRLILQACHAQPSRRFHSAAEFRSALEEALAGRRLTTRRKWLVASAGGVLALAGVGVVGARWLRAPARAVWRQVRKQPFNVEGWVGHMGTADSVRRRIYSLSAERDQWVFQTLNLDDFTVVASGFPDSPRVSVTTVLHPVTRQVWAVEAGLGEVTAVDPDSQALRRLGGGPSDDRHFGSGAYWNPVTHRIGVFGGYGHLAVRNDRHEFDEENRKWIQIEPNRPGAALWPRSGMLPLVQDASGQRLFVAGGQGSPSGKQGERFEGLRAFNSQFHYLDDIWELNVGTSTWRQVLALGYLESVPEGAAAHSA